MTRQNGDVYPEIDSGVLGNPPDYYGMMHPYYDEMTERLVGQQVEWAIDNLKTQVKIVWYLRFLRLSCARWLDTTYRAKKGSPRRDYAYPRYNEEVTRYNKKSKGKKLPSINWKCIKDVDCAFIEPVSTINLTPSFYVGRKIDAGRLRYNFNGLFHHYFALNIQEINQLRYGWLLPNQLFDKMAEIEERWKEKQKTVERMIPPEAYEEGKGVRLPDSPSVEVYPEPDVFLKFDDGWAWFDLNTHDCDLESSTMRHCGADDIGTTLLSLREPVTHEGKLYWKSHVTTTLHDDNYLSQMKGFANSKPGEEFWSYILDLIWDDRIKGMRAGAWDVHNDFTVTDLPREEQEEIKKKKPRLFRVKDYVERYGVDVELQNRLNLPDPIELDLGYRDELLDEYGDDDVRTALSLLGGNRQDLDDLLENPHVFGIDEVLSTYVAGDLASFIRTFDLEEEVDRIIPDYVEIDEAALEDWLDYILEQGVNLTLDVYDLDRNYDSIDVHVDVSTAGDYLSAMSAIIPLHDFITELAAAEDEMDIEHIDLDALQAESVEFSIPLLYERDYLEIDADSLNDAVQDIVDKYEEIRRRTR